MQENARARGGALASSFACHSRVTSRDSPKWRACSRAFFEVARETGSVSCQIALWDCFVDAIAAFIGHNGMRRRLGRECLSLKTVPWCKSTQHRPNPTRSLTCPPARTRIIWCYGTTSFPGFSARREPWVRGAGITEEKEVSYLQSL